jgi:hypothetical protein
MSIVFILFGVSFIVRGVLCAVFCLCCCFVKYAICVLRLIVVHCHRVKKIFS